MPALSLQGVCPTLVGFEATASVASGCRGDVANWCRYPERGTSSSRTSNGPLSETWFLEHANRKAQCLMLQSVPTWRRYTAFLSPAAQLQKQM